MPRRISVQVMTSQWKPTTMAINQVSYGASANTRVAQTFLHSSLTLTLTVNPRRAMTVSNTRAKNQGHGSAGLKDITRRRTERRTRPIALPFSLTWSVMWHEDRHGINMVKLVFVSAGQC